MKKINQSRKEDLSNRFGKMSREDFIEKVTFEYRPEGSRFVARDICCQNILGVGGREHRQRS